MFEVEHDDHAITALLRGYIAEIKQLDAEGAAIDRRRRDLYRQAAEYGFNAGILKKIARQKHDGEAEAEANEQIEYLRLIGGEKATDSMRKGKTFSEVAFGSCVFPSHFADAIGDSDSPLIRGWGEQEGSATR